MVVSQQFKHEEVLGLKFGYHPLGKPSMFTHIYHIDGLLIDTGQSNAQNSIIDTTRRLNVEQIFVTHHHEDHSGNIKKLKEIHNCSAYASDRCCQIMKNPPKLSFAQKLTWGDRKPQLDLIPKYDSIKTNRFHFNIIPIPGHAPDMVVLYEPNRQWLFSADLYINTYISYMLKDESIADQIESTKKILKLDFEAMFCSHKPQLKDGKQKLTKKLDFLESFFHDVASFYQKGYSADQIFKSLKLKESWFVQFLSGGNLSKMNMVKSVIRDVEKKTM